MGFEDPRTVWLSFALTFALLGLVFLIVSPIATGLMLFAAVAFAYAGYAGYDMNGKRPTP